MNLHFMATKYLDIWSSYKICMDYQELELSEVTK